jgi:L,D-transpeptidase ErfK/SrfK
MSYNWFVIFTMVSYVWLNNCGSNGHFSKNKVEREAIANDAIQTKPQQSQYAFAYKVPHEVQVKDYFYFMDTLVQRLDSLVTYDLNGILLARSNPWLIDTFIETDYYLRKARGEFVIDQKRLTILKAGDTLQIPSNSLAKKINEKIDTTFIDINIPEFRLRIIEGNDTIISFPVRVGQNRKRYLEATKRIEDLRTKTGVGKIVRVNRNPVWSNPVTAKTYKETSRDDGLRTALPQIPWLEPSLNGQRWGQLIHPTTNPETLGKAYSNGCVGTSEQDAWRLYFYAPIGTKVVIRYDRLVINSTGDSTLLPHIYDKNNFKLRN